VVSLIVAEHDNKNLAPNIRNIATAAARIGKPIHVLIIGSGGNLNSIAQAAAKVTGVEKVLVADNKIFENHLAESIAPAIASIAGNYSHIFSPATTFGKDFMPRLAAMLDIQQVSEIIEVIDENTFKRPIYAGNAIATVKSKDAKKIITVRTSNFDKAGETGSAAMENISISVTENNLSSFVSIQKTESARPELTAAKIVISGGRGVGSMENFKIIEKLADKLKAAIGASRAAVDAGYVPNDYQVGQTGKIVAPDLYMAIGISGAIQHLAGMKDSKIIVAINKDENAPIFEIADIGLVGDLFQIVPELESKI
jgi:electron transfer flavoprotein alpha subunit